MKYHLYYITDMPHSKLYVRYDDETNIGHDLDKYGDRVVLDNDEAIYLLVTNGLTATKLNTPLAGEGLKRRLQLYKARKEHDRQ